MGARRQARGDSAVVALPVIPKAHVEEPGDIELDGRTHDDHLLARSRSGVLGIQVEPCRQRDITNDPESERLTVDLAILQLIAIREV